MDSDFVNAVRESSERLGINPSDLLTAISYETGGKLSPSLWGGKGNDYLGLIQFGREERAKYGVHDKQSAVEQMGAVENFLRDRGVKPGMNLLDVYSTINAGHPGLYNRSDAANGGAPGTVADKVATQMFGHRKRADALLARYPGSDQAQTADTQQPAQAPAPTQEAQATPQAVSPQAQPAPASFGFVAAPSDTAGAAAASAEITPQEDPTAQHLATIQQLAQSFQQDQGFQPAQPMQINFPVPANVARARALAAAMRARPLG